MNYSVVGSIYIVMIPICAIVLNFSGIAIVVKKPKVRLLTLIVLPALYYLVEMRGEKKNEMLADTEVK